MKKLQNVGKIILLSLMLMVEMTTVCYADIVFSPVAHWRTSLPYFNIVIIIMGIILVIALVCAYIGKISNSDLLKEQSLKIAEMVAYYLLVVLGISFTVYQLSEVIIFGIIPLAILLYSLHYRLSAKEKKKAYGILVAYYIVVVVLFICSRY